MKYSKLLVLSALWLSSLGVNAADLVERTMPTNDDVEVKAVEFAVGQTYLLYNVTADAYFTQGNNWGTRGCVGPKASAVRIKVAQYKVDNVWDGKTYEIEDYVCVRSTNYSWMKACMDDSGNLFLDQTTWANRFYEIQPQGNLVYRFMPNEVNTTIKSDGTQFMGRDEAVPQDFDNAYSGFEDDAERYPLSALLTEGEGHHINWQFIDASVFDQYEKAMELKSVIETAEAEGIDVSAAVAVYNNLNSTVEQLQAQIDALNEARANNIGTGTADNPSNATALLQNPNFDNASNAGWSGTKPNMTGDGNHAAADVAEVYNSTFDTYQDITGLPAGVYCLSLRSFFRGTLADYLAGTATQYYPYAYAVADGDSCKTLFCNAYAPMNTVSFVDKYGDTTYFGTPNAEGSSTSGTTTYYAPNNPSTFRLYCEEEGHEYYKTLVFFEANGGEARVGVKKDALQGGTDWSVFDSFGLQYYGNTAASFQKWLELGVPEINLGEETVYTYSYLQAYNDKKKATVSNKAEVLAAMAEIEQARAELFENVALWKEYALVIDQARVIVNSKQADGSPTYAETDWFINCEDALDDYAKEVNEMALTNAKLREKIDALKANVTEAGKHFASDDVAADVTNQYLTNADFSANSWEGWTREGNLTGNVAVSNSCGEAWNTASFDIYQEVTDAPAGVYEISVQGFYRYGRGDNAWNNYQNASVSFVKPGGAPCFVYMNELATPFMNVFDEAITDNSIFTNSDYNTFTSSIDGNTYYAPNNMATAANCFASPSEVNPGQNMFTQKAYGLVVHQGDPMRVGVKGSSNQLGDSWVIFDNFKLTYRGNAANVVSEVLLTEVATAENIKGDMGKTAYENLAAAIANARTLAAGTDGDAMFQALLTLMDAEAAAKTSMALFDTLIEALNDLNGALMDGQNEDAKGNAATLKEDIEERLEKHLIEDEEVPELIAEIRKWITKLTIDPGFGSATDLNPVDLTSVVVNPSYDGGDNKGWTCAASVGVNNEVQNAEIFGGDNGVTYDYYQEIAGLPAGTYEISVQAFYRYGGDGPAQEFENRYDSSKDYVYIYGVTANGRSSKPIVRLSATPVWYSAEDLPSGWAFGDETTNEAVPNNMATAYEYFTDYESAVTNTIVVKVGDDEKLRFGLAKDVAVAKDWTIFDNWTLTYYGTESTKEVTGDQNQGIEELVNSPVKNVEFFSIDGRKATMGQKGGIVIMRQTLDNGTIVVRKVRK
ncbi:MAG: hypothetical protein II949_01230 [Prevotella sp.]|nr:hypothetical protein [Prevotella sp.]